MTLRVRPTLVPGGYVSAGMCDAPHCRAAAKAGRPWHAVPEGFAVVLPDHHFATPDEARAELVRVRDAVARPCTACGAAAGRHCVNPPGISPRACATHAARFDAPRNSIADV